MKARTIVLFVLVASLLLGSVALRQTRDSALAQSGGTPPAQYVVARGMASGGGYRLTGLSWQVHGASSGGGYRLLSPVSPSGGNQCCCTYLPCVLRNY
jgi:hypothetical protein